MARYFGTDGDGPTEDSERRVADAFKMLPDDWTVVHHVSWQSKRNGRQGDGEADFILLHPRKGLLVIEVKGGGIEIANGRWQTTNRFGETHEIKNPYEQATASKHALVGWLKAAGFDDRVRVGHAVAFPHLDTAPAAGPAATPAITLCRNDLASPDSAIERCCSHWALDANLNGGDVAKIIALLAPTISVRRTLADQAAEAEAGLLSLTAEQIHIFAGLRASRGGLMVGGAGYGKTVLAIARAQQLARDGFQTLLVCFNELLGAELASRVDDPPRLTARTFHSLCLSEARRARLPVPASPSADWWESGAPNLLIQACSANGSSYDAIVVDEGQDFSPMWLDALRCLTADADDAPFFVFADPRQEIWGRDWAGGVGFDVGWQLPRNLRNTQQIAERVAAVVGMEAVTRGINGPKPIWRDIRDPRRPERDVVGAVERLIDEGFGPQNMVVICCSAALVARLREYSIGPYSFGRWGGGGIPVETVSRFKGMEAEAVVLVLEQCASHEDRTAAYVGMSRARTLLMVVGQPQLKTVVNWITS